MQASGAVVEQSYHYSKFNGSNPAIIASTRV
jgi:hypothetical protein